MGRRTKESLENENIIVDRTMRDKCVEKYEVLEKVKEIILIPELEVMTVQQVAEYYGVGVEAIKSIVLRHYEELKSDGIRVESIHNFLKIHDATFQKERNRVAVLCNSVSDFIVTNRGLRVFPRRAILKIGMLLTESPVAREIRNQLLNIEEKVDDETKVQDITEEQRLMLSVGMAYASWNMDALLKATTEYTAFQNRHIQKLEYDNKALANGILEWSDRSKLSAGVRGLAAATGIPFANVWNELYKNLQYGNGICLKQRGYKPYIQWVKEDEWNTVIKAFSAMCEAYHQSPT